MIAGLVHNVEGPVQVAYVVDDVHAAALEWERRVGAGPFLIREHIALDSVSYRGQPTTFDHSSAYGQCGNLMVELVVDHTDGPSAIRDMFARGESGLHHMAYFVANLDVACRALQRHGFEVSQYARTVGGTGFCFVDTRPLCGHMIELYERSDRILAFYAHVASLASNRRSNE